MPRYIALLRGINVGGRNRVPMAELRATVEDLGHAEVSTFIQSGNVIFTSETATTTSELEGAIERRFGLAITVVVRTPEQLQQVVTANPFPDADPTTLHVGFMAHEPASPAVAGLDSAGLEPERFAIVGAELYLHLPGGIGRSKLPAYLDRRLKVPTTVRNWNTVAKLVELSLHLDSSAGA